MVSYCCWSLSRTSAPTVTASSTDKADIPHWGETSIHPHIHHPGEMFLDCPGLDIKMQPLGKVLTEAAINPAEAALVKALEQRGIWCLEVPAAICVAE